MKSENTMNRILSVLQSLIVLIIFCSMIFVLMSSCQNAQSHENEELQHFNNDIDYIAIIARDLQLKESAEQFILINSIVDSYFYDEDDNTLYNTCRIEISYYHRTLVYTFFESSILDIEI